MNVREEFISSSREKKQKITNKEINMNTFLWILAWFFEIVGICACVVTILFAFLYRAWSKFEAKRIEERKEDAK